MAPKKEPRQNGQQVEDRAPQLEDKKTGFSHYDLQYAPFSQRSDFLAQ